MPAPADKSFFGQTFFGNPSTVRVLEEMIGGKRMAQTLLLSGPEGVGKATLARRFAAHLLGDAGKIEQDDLSLAANRDLMEDREKWPAEKRNEDPLLFSSHPDFITFAPDGPLRQISIQQMRVLKERASLKPLKGAWRVFLIDGIDRANEQAANSLLKTLEEPPSHLMIIATARNPYDLLPTIRSRVVSFAMARLNEEEMRGFMASRNLNEPERRSFLAEGCPGRAVMLDLEVYDRRREAMLALLKVARGQAQYGTWLKYCDSIAARRGESLQDYVEVLYILLEDVLRLAHNAGPIRNQDVRRELSELAQGVTFPWVRAALGRADDMLRLARRNIQKALALDAFATALRAS